jgi:hypothetical protein
MPEYQTTSQRSLQQRWFKLKRITSEIFGLICIPRFHIVLEKRAVQRTHSGSGDRMSGELENCVPEETSKENTIVYLNPQYRT